MGRLSSRSVFLTLAGVALIALVTGLLRARWQWWVTVVALGPTGELRVRLLAMLVVGLLLPLLEALRRQGRWPVRHVAAAVVGVVIGLGVGTVLAENGDSPRASSREYAMMMYLLKVAAPSVASSEITGGLMGTTIAVVDETTVNNAAIRLRRAICEGLRDRVLTHIITIGGPDAALTGRVLQKAVRWLPKYEGSRIEILIVTPSPIPDDAKQALKGKGLKFREIEHQFPEPHPQR